MGQDQTLERLKEVYPVTKFITLKILTIIILNPMLTLVRFRCNWKIIQSAYLFFIAALSLLFFSCSTRTESEKDLLVYWSFDKTINGTTGNSSEHELNSINRGAKFVEGYKGKAMEFDGSSVLEIPYSAVLDSFPGGITVTAWIKKDTSSYWNTVVSREIDSTWSEYIGLAVFKNKALFSIDPDGKRYTNTTDSINVPSNKWVHIAGTYDNETIKLYKNGILISSVALKGPMLFNDRNPLLIGGNSNDMNHTLVDCFKGDIDEVRIYKRALSVEELRELINK